MKRRRIRKTPCGNAVVGDILTGCQFCMKGEKATLFITGRCNANCFYCPLPRHRTENSRVWVDDFQAKSSEEIVNYIKEYGAKGISITGGNPLLNFSYTCEVIKLLKHQFGQEFHIHLYTNNLGLSRPKIRALEIAGLDEIRIHMVNKQWSTIQPALDTSIVVGIEMPALPGNLDQLQDLVYFMERHKIQYLNLNELEFSRSNEKRLSDRRFQKTTVSEAARGSGKVALSVLDFVVRTGKDINVNFCTSKAKRISLSKKFARHASRIRLSHEEITSSGCIRKGVVFPINSKGNLMDLYIQLKNILDGKDVPLYLNSTKNRIETTPIALKKIIKSGPQLGVNYAIIDEEPTFLRKTTRIFLHNEGKDKENHG